MPSAVQKFRYRGEDALRLSADRKAFDTLRQWLSEIAAELNLTERIQKQLLIACDEVFTNIATHAYAGNSGEAVISIEFEPDDRILRIIFCDSGKEFNPLEAPTPDITAKLADRAIGGLGIFMVKKMMDSLTYRREGEFNILTIEKKMEISDK